MSKDMNIQDVSKSEDIRNDTYGKTQGKGRFSGTRVFGTKDYLDGIDGSVAFSFSDEELRFKGKKSVLFPTPDYQAFAEKTSYLDAWHLKQVHNGIVKDRTDYPHLVREYAESVVALRAAVDKVEDSEGWDLVFQDVLDGKYNKALKRRVRFSGEEDAREKGFLMTPAEKYEYLARNCYTLRPLQDFEDVQERYSLRNAGGCKALKVEWGTRFFHGFDPDVKDGWVLAYGNSVIAQNPDREPLSDQLEEAVSRRVREQLEKDAEAAEKRRKARRKKGTVKFAQPEKVIRTGGPDYRRGRAVTTWQYRNLFKIDGTLYGVQYSKKQRDDVLNSDYDCWADLCEALRIGPASIGQGKLVTCFGAKGCGKAAGGFYSPEEKAIFIPKKESGSKSHEFFHFSDHMAGLFLGGYTLASECLSRERIREGLPKFAELLDALDDSEFAKEGYMLDSYSGRRKPYYSATWELLARAGEKFVQTRLEGLGITNTSLNYVKDLGIEYKGRNITGYPEGEELERFNRLLAETVDEFIEKGIFTPYEGAAACMLEEPAAVKTAASVKKDRSPRKKLDLREESSGQVSFFNMF